jgi:hypothetical protein
MLPRRGAARQGVRQTRLSRCFERRRFVPRLVGAFAKLTTAPTMTHGPYGSYA